MILNEIVIYVYLTLAEHANLRSLQTVNIMLHRPTVIKFVSTLIWAFVLYIFAFFIKMINEVFDFHWVIRFIAVISSAALDLEVFIHLEY